MPVKFDSQRRWVEVDVVVPGTPEQVWRAIATGPGMACWFTNASVDGRPGGDISFDFGGGMTSAGSVLTYEPPRRMVYEERNWSGEAPPIATEIEVIARGGGKCIVRMVHSLFTTADTWDDEMESFEDGWPTFFAVLDVYLREFADQAGHLAWFGAVSAGTAVAAWKRVAGALGIRGADVGDRVGGASDTPPFGGTVATVHHNGKHCGMMVRVDEPAPGVALVGTYGLGPDKARVDVNFYFYGDGAPAVIEAQSPRWKAWLASLFGG